jgi:predicted short-subunit dehydrogenase-like oxidoreductase (DUF2520 family)
MASNLSVGVIGAGRVGAVLGAALSAAGHPVVAASGAADRIAALLPGTRHRRPVDVARAADLVLIAVPDDALGPLVAQLADAGALRAGQVVAHTSGAYGTGVLQPAVARGADPLAMHPAMTFTGTRADLDRLAAGIRFGVTVPTELRPFAAQLVAELGGSPEWIDEADRVLYHAALAHGANHLTTVVNEAADLLRAAGVAEPAPVLGPLLRAALENALRIGDAALTGPVSRADAGTVARHLAALAAAAPESVPVYRELARRTAARAVAAGRLTQAAAAPLLDLLSQEEGAAA